MHIYKTFLKTNILTKYEGGITYFLINTAEAH